MTDYNYKPLPLKGIFLIENIHPQALCNAKNILEGASEFDVISLENTEWLRRRYEMIDETAAAIAGRINGKIYDLSILEENIQDRSLLMAPVYIVSGEKVRKDAKKVSLCMELSMRRVPYIMPYLILFSMV